MTTLCGVQEDVVIKSENSKAVLRLVTDDMYTDEGFSLTVRSGKQQESLPVGGLLPMPPSLLYAHPGAVV